MKTLAYYNGEIAEISELKIPLSDRSIYFGDGVYEACSVRNHKIFALDEHIDRFFNSARLLKIKLAFSKEYLKTLLMDLVKKVDLKESFLYWQATRGHNGERSHSYNENLTANLLVTITKERITGKDKIFKLTHTEDTRFLHCNIKTLNLIPSIMAVRLADDRGCDETVFHRGNIVTECAHSNIHILKDGVFITHPANELILPGIARAHLIKACMALNIEVVERPFTFLELLNADEIIISSSTVLCNRANEIDKMKIGMKDDFNFMRIQDYVFDEFNDETK